jgi:hypothetical protein
VTAGFSLPLLRHIGVGPFEVHEEAALTISMHVASSIVISVACWV